MNTYVCGANKTTAFQSFHMDKLIPYMRALDYEHVSRVDSAHNSNSTLFIFTHITVLDTI